MYLRLNQLHYLGTVWLGLGSWCLTPLSTIFSVTSWRSVFLVEETGVPGKTHRPAAITDKLYHIMLYQGHLV